MTSLSINMVSRISVLGAGSWGTALAILLHNNGHVVTLWGRPEDGIDTIKADRVNHRFLPGVVIPEGINITTDSREALTGAEMVVLAVPSQAVREVLKRIKSLLEPQVVLVNTAKGLELKTNMRMSQVSEEVLGTGFMKRYAVLSGPSHAEEVGRGLPTAVVVSSPDTQTACKVQDTFMSRVFRVYTNPDIIGVEMGGALKNVIALATGMAEGLRFGDNTGAALLTRGLAEVTRLGVQAGAEAKTFAGLSGLGDLVVTCGSTHSRNRRAGRLIGQGYSRLEAQREVGMVVEGITTTEAACRLARAMETEMPITMAVNEILFHGSSCEKAVWQLMERSKRDEAEDYVWLNKNN